VQSGAQYRLVMRRGPQPNQQFELTRDKITIGRDVTNDIIISDPEISRHHARLIRTGNGYAIEDLRSTNGTFVNRQRISAPQQLYDGDLVGLGETVTLTYEAVGASMGVTMPGRREQPPYREPAGPPPYVPPRPGPTGPPPPPPPQYRDYLYDYDYEEEEEEPDRNRLLVISCAALTLFFCCVLVAGAIYIDSANLYCDVPIVRSMDFFCLPTPIPIP